MIDFNDLLNPWLEEKLMAGFNEDAYHATTAMSSGQIKTALDSPAHFKALYTQPKKDPSPAMRFGSMAHKLILEGPEFLKRYRVMPEFSGTGSKAKKEAWLADQSPTAIILDAEELEKLRGMSESILANPTAAYLLAGTGERREMSGWFNHEGFRCKMRADIFREDGMIVDLKTAADASPIGFQKAAWDMRYPIQAYWYLLGASKLLGRPMHELSFNYIVIEKEPPFACAVYTAEATFLEAGERLTALTLNRLRKSILSNVWPSYGHQARTLMLPKYALYNLEEMEIQDASI